MSDMTLLRTIVHAYKLKQARERRLIQKHQRELCRMWARRSKRRLLSADFLLPIG